MNPVARVLDRLLGRLLAYACGARSLTAHLDHVRGPSSAFFRYAALTPAHRLRAAGAAAVFDHMSELPQLVGGAFGELSL